MLQYFAPIEVISKTQEEAPNSLSDTLRPLYRNFIEKELKEEGSISAKAFYAGVTYAAVCFPKHPLDVQVYIGIYSWLGLFIDDEAHMHPEEFAQFGARFVSGEPHPLPLLQGWADLLPLAYKYWDATVANFIVSASLNFMNANLLETEAAFRRVKETPANKASGGGGSGRNWAWYVRERDGDGEAVAYKTFPKSMYPDAAQYLECIPDLNRYIASANDVLSFYKEERIGDSNNYISQLATYDNKAKIDVLKDTIQDVSEAVQRMRATLKGEGKEAYAAALEDHILGYVDFHRLSPRYRLWEVGIGKESDKTFASLDGSGQ
ncbi:hypothetical protein PG997_014432 [Apiospora hydei]|uniref:Trichodiene synthase n=1 Tax=Apiospora hydei TaxID=1337664 RepID=A0ABR1UTT0_9PEZI